MVQANLDGCEVWLSLSQSDLCTAICGLALGDALALPEEGSVDLQQAAQSALQRREVFLGLAPEVQAKVLNALINGGITQGQREPGRPGQDRALARYVQCWSLGLGDALLLPEDGPVDLQHASHAAQARRGAFSALHPAAQEQVLKALVNAGITHGMRQAGRPGQDRELACYAQCCSLGLGDALLLPEVGPVDLQSAAQAALARRDAFAALQPDVQEQALKALVGAGITHGMRQDGRPGRDRALACYAQCCSLGLGDALLLPEDGPVDLQHASHAAQARRGAFSALHPAAQEQVLKALYIAGFIHYHRQDGRPAQDRALACWAQCCSLGLGDALLLPEDGPVDLQHAAQAALTRRDAFAALQPAAQEQVLKALVNAGITHGMHQAGRPGQDRELACYAQCCSLGLGDALLLPEDGPVDLQTAAQPALERRGAFASLQPAAQEQVLKALVNAGVTHGLRQAGRPGRDRALACYAQCCSLGLGDALLLPEDGPVDLQHASHAAQARRGAFSALHPAAQEQVLKALFYAGITHGLRQADRPGQDRALACYAQCCSLGLGDALLLPEDGPVDLQHAAQAAQARRDAFAALQPAAQAQVLKALVNAGVTHGLRQDGRPGQDRALACCAQCCSLGLGDALLLPEDGPVDLQHAAQAALARRDAFAALQPDVQEQALKALVGAGITHGMRQDGRPGQDRGLACWAQCCSLGLGDALLLPEDDPVDLQNAAQAALARRAAFAALEPTVQAQVLRALFSAFGLLNNGAVRPLPWAIAVSLLPRDVQSTGFCQNVLKGTAPGARHSPHSTAAAVSWLTRLYALPASPQQLGQVEAVLGLADRVLALQRREQQPLGRWLQAVDGSGGQGHGNLWALVCQSRGWPLRFIELPHWLAALGMAGGCIDVAQLKDLGQWTAHVALLAERCGWLRCLDADGSARQSHILSVPSSPSATVLKLDTSRWQVDKADHPRWNDWLLTLSKGEPLEDIEYSFASWWQHLLPSIEDMFTWRQRWLPDEPADAAWQASAEAAVMAQSDRFVQQVWQRASAGLPVEVQTLPFASPDSAPCSTPTNLQLSWLRHGHSTMTDRLLLAQQYWAGHLIAQSEDAAQLWRLLEVSRHSLLPAKPGSLQWRDWDKTAVDALVAAEQRVLRDAQARLDAQAQGRSEPPNCLNADVPIEPFATMAEQWARMGVGLEVPTAQAAARCLGPHEALIQPWWDADGQGYVLMLQPAQALRRLSMPSALHGPSWQTLDRAWQEAARLDARSDSDDFDLDEAFALAWQAIAAHDSAAVTLWQWLREQAGPGCTNLILVWPADKAAWPWQALVETLEPEVSGATMELAVSAAALLKSRTPARDNGAQPATVARHAALFSDDLWRSALDGHAVSTRIEASVLPHALRQQARRSADAACYLQALQCNGLVHLAAHGVYDDRQPLASHLVLHDQAAMQREAQGEDLARRRARRRLVAPHSATEDQLGDPPVTQNEPSASSSALETQRHALPAWLLAEMHLAQPDVSLSACQALRVGVGDESAALKGPAGLGAVLSAAGARSVVGSLWACESLSIALFYERWFHHRQQHDALGALRRARQDLRTMTWDDYERWTEHWMNQAQAQGLMGQAEQDRLASAALQLVQQRRASVFYRGRIHGPFEHPADWAGVCLIGNAPARPDALWEATTAAQAPIGWWQRMLQRLGLGQRGR